LLRFSSLPYGSSNSLDSGSSHYSTFISRNTQSKAQKIPHRIFIPENKDTTPSLLFFDWIADSNFSSSSHRGLTRLADFIIGIQVMQFNIALFRYISNAFFKNLQNFISS